MPVLMRNKDGQAIEVADEDVKFYADRGYEPETTFGAVTRAATPDDGGALGTANAGARGFWSGLTLGASDVVSSALSTDLEREQLRAERTAHPIAAGVGEIAGLVAPALVSGGASLPESTASLGARALEATPAGYLSRFAAGGAEAGRAIGGLEGAAKVAAYSGIEGAGQAAGSYISDVALGDRELTAEGLAGALGHGFEFGAAAGAVTHGIERGTIAARRLFARTAEGGTGAALTAEQELARSTQATLEAQEAAAEAARAQLSTAQQAREAAELATQKARADLLEVRNSLQETADTVQRGIPEHDALEAHLREIRAPAITQTVPTDELLAHGVFNDTASKWSSVSTELNDKTLPTVLAISPSGKVVVRANPQALKAAAEHGQPARVHWTVMSGEPHPLAEAISTSGLEAERKATQLLEETKAKIAAGQIPGEVGPFTPEGLDLAAKREIARQARKEPDLVEALKEYDAAKAEMEAVKRQVEAAPRAPRAARVQVEPPKTAEIPSYTTLRKAKVDYIESTVPARDIAERGYYEPPGGHLDATRTSNARKAIAEGQREPISLVVSESGKIQVEGGRHRLQAAIEADAPIKVKWSYGYEPSKEMVARGAAAKSGSLEVKRVGRPSEGKFEVRNPDGTVTQLDRNSARELAESQMPPGFTIGPRMETHRDFSILRGVPKTADEIVENSTYVVKPSELAHRGVIGNEIHPEHLSSMIKARAGEVRLEPIDIRVTQDGRMYVEDGNHRLQVAARTDAPVAVNFRAAGDGYKPQQSSRDITGRLLADLPAGRGRRAALDPLAGFAQDVHDAIARIGDGPAQRYGREGVFISAIHDEMRQAGYRGSLADFKRELIKANREQLLNLNRADLVDAMPGHAVEASEIADMGSTFHFVEDQGRGRRAAAAAPQQSPLERQLAAMKTQLDSGADIGTLSRTRTASPRSPEQLETAYEEAIQRADAAKDVGEKQMHLREAAALEEQLKQTPRRSVVEDIGDMAPVMTRYERAAARVTELAGGAAPEAARAHAVAFREAEAEAERKMMDRTARAIDDAQNPLISPEGKLAKARAGKAAADIELAKARVAETEASLGARAAADTAKFAREAFEAAQPKPPEPGLFGQLAGMPEAHAIPVIGPMLNRYAQGKIMVESAKRFVGRVPATATGKAAALAARVRDKIASAVDRSLGLIERAAPDARRPAVAVLGVLERRAFDDGEPGAPKGASATKLAAVRIREVAAAATNPDRVIAQVRGEMRDVTDPDLIAAAEKHRVAMYQHLNDNAPKGPPPNPYTKREWEPSPAEALRFARRLEVANDPVAAFEALHQQCLTTEAAETLRAVWPKLFGEAQQRLVSRAQDIKKPVAYDQLLRNSLLFDVPLHPSLEPDNAVVLRSAFAPMPPTPGTGAPQPPVPSISGGTNLTALYQPGPAPRASMR